MVEVRIRGGLGNQLFQYAAGYALTKRLNQPLLLDTSYYPTQTLRGFRLAGFRLMEDVEINEKSPNRRVKFLNNRCVNRCIRTLHMEQLPIGKNSYYLLQCKSDVMAAYKTIEKENIYLSGYFQNPHYFEKYRKELLEQLVPNYSSQPTYTEWEKRIQQSNSVAIHVRRGDLLKAQNNRNPRHYLLEAKYYHDAVKWMKSRIEEMQCFWFSDDIEWVKTEFGMQEGFHFVKLKTDNQDIDELMLMSKCKNIIAGNSTFSWWGAWLNQNQAACKIVPAKPFGEPQMIPGDWIKL